MTRIIEKKVWPEYFEQVFQGRKKFEVRLNDFDIEEGDTLLLREWDPEKKDYTGRQIEKKVGCVGKWKLEHFEKFWDKKDIDEKGLMVISLVDEDKEHSSF